MTPDDLAEIVRRMNHNRSSLTLDDADRILSAVASGELVHSQQEQDAPAEMPDRILCHAPKEGMP